MGVIYSNLYISWDSFYFTLAGHFCRMSWAKEWFLSQIGRHALGAASMTDSAWKKSALLRLENLQQQRLVHQRPPYCRHQGPLHPFQFDSRLMSEPLDRGGHFSHISSGLWPQHTFLMPSRDRVTEQSCWQPWCFQPWSRLCEAGGAPPSRLASAHICNIRAWHSTSFIV